MGSGDICSCRLQSQKGFLDTRWQVIELGGMLSDDFKIIRVGVFHSFYFGRFGRSVLVGSLDLRGEERLAGLRRIQRVRTSILLLALTFFNN